MASEAAQGLQNALAYLWEYADATARGAASGFTSDDVGKLARQLDNNTLWMLTATTPTWNQVGGTAVPSFATPAIVLGTAAAAGAAGTVIRSDGTIVAFDATVPSTQAYGDSAATGSAAVAARRDHKHAMPAIASDATITTTDITTNNVTSTKHGFAPKSPADATQFLNGATTPAYAQVKDSDLSTTDITTNNVSTSKHGFAPKGDANAAHYLDGTGAYSTPSGSGMTNPMSHQDAIIIGGSSGTPTELVKGSDGYVLSVDPSTHHLVWASGSSASLSADETTYWRDQASLLDPTCLETFKTGAFSYAISGGATKYVVASFKTRIGSTGQMEVRDPSRALPLSGVTLVGRDSGAGAIICDTTLATYTDPKATYYTRLKTLATTTPIFLPLTAASTNVPFLPGAYGAIILMATVLDMTWVIIRPGGASLGINLANEIGNSSSDYQSNSNRLLMPVNKAVCASFESGVGRAGGDTQAGLLYILLPSSWTTIADATSYNFRDDFMGASIDTGSTWTRTQSTGGNFEINTTYQWCKVIGDGTWGHNGMYSQSSISRANGKVFMCDVNMPLGSTNTGVNLVVGFSDGGGHSYTNFSHCVDFTGNGGKALNVFENGTSRGSVGSGWTGGTTYRVRITLGASNTAVYEIQSTDGVYAALGGTSWTTLSPSSTSSSTTPLHAGVTKLSSDPCYVSDVKIY